MKSDLLFYYRFSRVMAVANIPHIEVQLMLFLFLEPGFTTEVGLSEILRLPRSTVRAHVAESIALGMVERTSEGVRHTEQGREIIAAFSTEAVAIAKGEQPGFSENMADQILSIQKNSLNAKKARTLKNELIDIVI